MAQVYAGTQPKLWAVVDDAEQDNTVVPIKYDISSWGADYDVEGLVKRLERNDIYIPTFQRAYVWTLKEASRFVESLLLGLPVPGVFLARDPDSKRLLVIDGHQRLKTLQYFYSGFFAPRPNEKSRRVFELVGVQRPFVSKTYQTLTEETRIALNDTIIHATIVKQESPPDDNTSIYHVFERLNTSGRKLTPQQIRAAIYPGGLLDAIKRLNSYPKWRDIFGPESAMLKDQELILRFFALHYEAANYARPMNEFLNKFMSRRREPSPEFLEEAEALFRDAIDTVHEALGSKAFRPERALNAVVFDSVMVGLANRIQKPQRLDIGRFATQYAELLVDKGYLVAVSQSTSDDKNVAFRLKLVNDRFAEALMRSQELTRQLQILSECFRKTSSAVGGDLEMQAHWARYLCVLSAGFIENALAEIYTEFVRRAASEPVANHASSVVSKVQNPKAQKFVETAAAFKARWGEELEAFLEEKGRRDAIDSIMANRHLIAHGKNSGITVARLQSYLSKAIEVVEYVENQCSH